VLTDDLFAARDRRKSGQDFVPEGREPWLSISQARESASEASNVSAPVADAPAIHATLEPEDLESVELKDELFAGWGVSLRSHALADLLIFCYTDIMQERVTMNRRGVITIPAKLREAYGLRPNDELIAESSEQGILLRPAVSVPLELYTEQRIASFSMPTCSFRRARPEAILRPSSTRRFRRMNW
jgi:AbrB family looped-hinge helix DNA binding protein